jgi:hypothetical protein
LVNPDAELDTPVRRDIYISHSNLALHLAQRTASTTLPNSIRLPSPVVLMRRPPLAAMTINHLLLERPEP